MVAIRLLIPVVLALMTTSSAEELILRLKVVPQDVQVLLQGEQLPYDIERRGYLVKDLKGKPPLQLEVRKPGYKSVNLELSPLPQSKVVEVPSEPSQIIYLQPQSFSLLIRLEPSSDLWLEAPQSAASPSGGEYFLGRSDQEILLPYGLATDASGEVTVRAEAFCYKSLRIKLNLDEISAGQWPAEGSAELEPSIRILGPILNWLSRHRGVTTFLLLACLVGIVITGVQVARVRQTSTET